MDEPEATAPGEVVAIHVAPEAGAPMRSLASVTAVANEGLAGDRYRGGGGGGHFSQRPGGGSHLTLVEVESLDAIAAETGVVLSPADSRRNLATRGVRLADLVGRRFAVGDAVCIGIRPCEPCAHLADLLGRRGAAASLVRALAHRAGLRAEIVGGGVIRPGDPIRLLPDGEPRGDAVAAPG